MRFYVFPFFIQSNDYGVNTITSSTLSNQRPTSNYHNFSEKNTATRRFTPGCVRRNPQNFNKKAPELKLVGYPFLYIPVNIPLVSPRRGLRWARDRVLWMCAMPPPRFVWTTHVNRPTWTAPTEESFSSSVLLHRKWCIVMYCDVL